MLFSLRSGVRFSKFPCFSIGAAMSASQRASSASGWTAEKFAETGERIWNLEREFNNRAGFAKKDDILPVRVLTEPAQSGAGKGFTVGLDEMLPEYYAVRGWTPESRLDNALKARLPL